MPYIPFILLSAPEYIAVLFLTFALFRIKPQGFYPHILFIAFILGNVSYATRADEAMVAWSPSIQMAVAIVCMWLLFRIPLFYASIIATVANVIYGLLQLLVYIGYSTSGIVNFEEVNTSSFTGYIVPLSSIILSFVGVIVIRSYNLSIDWIPNNPRARVPINRENVLFIVLVVLIFIVYSAMYFWRINGFTLVLFSIATLLLILLMWLFYMSRKRDTADD